MGISLTGGGLITMKFDPDKHKTYGDLFAAANSVRTVEGALEFLEGYAKAMVTKGKTQEEALALARSNIGYLLGYGASQRACDIWSEARTFHPIFGDVCKLGTADAKKAVKAGRKAAGK